MSLASGGVDAAVSGVGSDGKRLLGGVVKHGVGKDYFRTTGIVLRLGRSFANDDEAGGATAIIVRASLVTIGAPSEGHLPGEGERVLASMSASVSKMNSTSASDPVVLIGAPLQLARFARVDCYLPARRSTRIDPVVALRQE